MDCEEVVSSPKLSAMIFNFYILCERFWTKDALDSALLDIRTEM